MRTVRIVSIFHPLEKHTIRPCAVVEIWSDADEKFTVFELMNGRRITAPHIDPDVAWNLLREGRDIGDHAISRAETNRIHGLLEAPR